MSDQLSAAAQAVGGPEELVMRSARARAEASGTDVETILAAWAGGESAVAAAPASTPEPAAEVEAPVAPAAPEPVATASQPVTAAPVASAGPVAITPPPTPETVTPEEALNFDVVISVPTAGLKERTSTTIPQWLVAALVVVPLFGLLYLASNGTADAACDPEGVTLKVDRATGALENCDGSAFEGRGGPGDGGAEFIVLGGEVYQTCAACHGANGGGGTGPAFSGVLLTFSSCTDHIEWIQQGSAGFQAAGRSTYGDIGKTISGGMPGFALMTPEELASVAAFERIRFGGGDPEVVFADCGLVNAESDEAASEELG